MTRKRRIVVVLVVIALVTLALSWRWLATWPARILVRDDYAAPGGPYLIVLMGETSPMRADKALELFQRGVGERILMAREEPYGFVAEGLAKSGVDMHAEYLVRRGIPAERLVIVEGCNTTSTVDEATCLLDYMKAQGPLPESVPVVTAWYHTRRAGWLIESNWGAAGPHVAMVSATTPNSNPNVWLEEEVAGIAVVMEYIKAAYWLL